jgi:hypothetical protein
MNVKAEIVGVLGVVSGILMIVNARNIASSGWRAYRRHGNKELAPLSLMTWGMLPSERAWRIFLRVVGLCFFSFGVWLFIFAATGRLD